MSKYLETSMAIGHLSNFGPLHEFLTRRLELFLLLREDRKLTLVSSGHTALMAAYAALGVKRAVVPAYTFESTRAAATLQGVEVIPVDVDPKSGCLSVEVLETVPKDTQFDCVVVVCALSSIPDLKALHVWCRANNKTMIVDGAATFGTPGVYHAGDAFCLSFHATKTFSVGEGGAVIANPEVSKKIRSYINFGFDAQKNIVLTGTNGKIIEYTSAIAMSILDKISPEIDARIKNYTRYAASLYEFLPETHSDRTVYQALPVFCKTVEAAALVREDLAAAGVQTLTYYPPFKKLPVASDLYSRNVCVPIHSGVTEDHIDFISNIIIRRH